MKPMLTANGLLGILFPWHNGGLVKQVAGEVARQCRAGLWRRVYPHAANMSIAQIRGYVRSHAAGCVDEEVSCSLSRRRLNPALHRRVTDAAVDQLILMLAHDILCGQLPVYTRPMAA